MIKANDIRVGNFIIDPECPLIISTVEEIQNDGFIVTNYNDHLTNKRAEPKPLTKDVLESNFKAKRHEVGEGESYTEYFDLGKLTVCDWGDGLIMSNSFAHGIRIKLESVHQLQNLYYSITGDELECVW